MRIRAMRKYEQNRKIKKDVDKNQMNYTESPDEPIKFIKRVNIFITNKKGSILENVKITFDDKEIITGKYGLLISQFPNKETSIVAEKEGYKTATAQMILNAEIQTHEFYLALEESDEESTVISTDETADNTENKGYNYGEIIFQPPLDGTDEITSWSGTNSTHDGIYDAHGSILAEGWDNSGLWQLEYDVAYSGKNTYLQGYIGTMPICSGEPYGYGQSRLDLTTWEGDACPKGSGATVIGPIQYKYSNRQEYHHAIFRKTSETELEFEFDGNIWYYTIPELPNISTLYIGARDNAASSFSRALGENILYKNIKVISLNKKDSSAQEETFTPTIYSFISYEDSEGQTKWAEGTVETTGVTENGFTEVQFKTNTEEGFVGQKFYITSDAKTDGTIYPLYSDAGTTSVNIYVSISTQSE